MYSTATRIEKIQVVVPTPAYDLLPIDDVSLAFSLGIRCKTLWWMVVKNNVKEQDGGRGMYKEFKIPKPNGEFRVIHEPCEALKNVQKAILVAYLNPLEMMECVGAYVPKRAMVTSVRRHEGARVKISLDVKDFFGSTRRPWVRAAFLDLGFSNDVAKILSSLTTIPLTHADGVVRSVLPQGAPTSGAMANLVGMRRLDVPIESMLDDVIDGDVEWAYTRYSDNIEVSFNKDLSRDVVDNVIVMLRGVLSKAGYRVRWDKTHVQRRTSPKHAMSMLGFTINEKVNIPKQEYQRLRAIVFNCAHKGVENQVKRYGAPDEAAFLASLMGRLIYWREVAPWKMQPLINEMVKLAGKTP